MATTQEPAVKLVCPGCGAVNRAPVKRLDAGDRPKCGQCGTALFTGQPIAIASVNIFDRHRTQSEIPLVIDFWAEWCGPCLAMAPQFAAAAQQMEPKVRLAKLDTEALPEIAGRYDIRGIPTLILFRGGREAARHSGLMDANTIVRWITANLS
ncbi:MAG TPA: thioredoxin TrxC [Hyphomicrobiales bacterium]|nr:thioredoxin TrxC [Hyphomicrobiales bacterium]